MSYLIHKRSQALRAKLSFSTPMGGVDNANPTHLVVVRTSPLILALILLLFSSDVCESVGERNQIEDGSGFTSPDETAGSF